VAYGAAHGRTGARRLSVVLGSGRPMMGFTTALAVLGAIISTVGYRRAARGAALARGAASIQSQLTRPPDEVIAEAMRGRLLAASGLRLARNGFRLAAGGCAATLILAVIHVLT